MQGAPRSETGSARTVTAPKPAPTTPTKKRSFISTTTATRASLLGVEVQQGPPGHDRHERSPLHNEIAGTRDRCKQNKRLGLPERQLSESLQHCSLGLPEFPESPQQQIGGAGVSSGVGPQYHRSRLLPGENVFCCRLDCFGLLAHRFWGRWTCHRLGLPGHRF